MNEDLQQLKALALKVQSKDYSINDCNAFCEETEPDKILALIARIESLAADAERYQFIRSAQFGSLTKVKQAVADLAGEKFDQAIDAAIAKEKAGKHGSDQTT